MLEIIEQADLIMPSVIQQGKYIHLMLLGYQPYLQIVRSFQSREI